MQAHENSKNGLSSNQAVRTLFTKQYEINDFKIIVITLPSIKLELHLPAGKVLSSFLFEFLDKKDQVRIQLLCSDI